ncbi:MULTISPECIES: SPFH domain-containing protein [unclassified Amycolatopsis]|uniref:SPFH domain-containing protein n=2 Tax=Amycolatopsis TaxID=1813 RepID=UPI00106EB29B|nr:MULTISPECIES: SPFH domain-containing protein [unclassified Amycolatopsis]
MAIVVVALLALFVIITVVKAIMVVPQAQSAVIERLGRFRTVASPGLTFLVPFLDKVRARIDLREQVVSFPPQPVITEDNLTVNIDTVVYFQVTDSRAAVYEISNYIIGVEQLTTTTLRNVVGGMSLEETLTSRDSINTQLRGVLDEATGRWGIRVARVELKAIEPPASIQDSMEKQMRADREKRAMILTAEGQRESSIKTAEGQKQSQILAAEGQKQAAILAAEAERQSRILRAQGERAARYLQAQGQAKAIEKVFAAIKAGRPTPEVLAYQYLQTLPQMAQGDANKVWMIPSDYGKALEGFARALGAPGDDGVFRYEPPKDDTPAKPDLDDDEVAGWFDTTSDPKVAEAVAAAEAVARKEVEGPLGASSGESRRAIGGAPAKREAPEPVQEEEPPAPPERPQPSAPPPAQQQQSLPQPQPPAGPPQGGPYQGPPPQQFGGPQGPGPGSGPFPQQGPFGGPQGGPPPQR